MREVRRVAALAFALLLAHCAWQRAGVSATISLVSDDPAGPRRVLDASGDEHVIDRAVLSVRSISLVRCPGTTTASLFDHVGPARASAHGDEAMLGPLEVDLAQDAPLAETTIVLLPGLYCDVRIAVDALSISADSGALTLEAHVDREVVLRMPRQALDAPGREVRITLVTSTSELLERVDSGAPDPERDGLTALGAALASMHIELDGAAE